MESFLLHSKLLPRTQDGMFPYTYLLLHVGVRHLPRSSSALRSLKGPLREHAADPRHRACLSLCPGHNAGSCEGASALTEASGEPVNSSEPDVEALAAALLLHGHAALSVPAVPVSVCGGGTGRSLLLFRVTLI